MKTSMINTFKGNFLYVFAQLVHKTCQFKISGLENLQSALESGEPVIGTSWHGMTMMILGSLRRYVDLSSVVTIIPEDFRGDILEIFLNKLGIYPAKLNLSGDPSMETSRKLVGIIRELSAGKYFLIHPDGPAGPAYAVKPGLTAIAQKAGAMIIPLGGYCRNAYHWHRWDSYTWPLPFSKIHIHVGQPISIDPDIKDLTEINHQVENILNQVAVRASANYYGQPSH
jgi:lysophospholipid acyltransferase (LPLAT)-like uncharacterized protein